MTGRRVVSGIQPTGAPARAILFVQSRIGAHAELAWLLSCVMPLGWLERMIQLKTRSAALDSVGDRAVSNVEEG